MDGKRIGTFPNWSSSEQGKVCLKEIESRYELELLEKFELFGPVFLFQTLRNNPEYYEVLQSLCLPLNELPLFVNSEFDSVHLVLETRLKYNI